MSRRRIHRAVALGRRLASAARRRVRRARASISAGPSGAPAGVPRPDLGPLTDAAHDPTARLRRALSAVAEAEALEPLLPREEAGQQLLARGRVIRRPELDPAAARIIPGRHGRWGPDEPGVHTLRAAVAADVIVLGKLDLHSQVKFRAVYAEAGLTLAAQPPTARAGSGIGRAVRAHEVVERHAPDLIPRMLAHGRLSDGLPFLVERWVPGRPLGGAAALGRAAPRLLAGLADIHRGHGVTHVRLGEHWGEDLPRRWQETCRTGIVPPVLAAWVEELIARDGSVRRSFIHGDLVASNVLALGEGLVLVDWEHAHEGVLMNDAAKLHLFASPSEEVLTVIADVLGDVPEAVVEGPEGQVSSTPYLPLEELALCHAQLLSRYPSRRVRLHGHVRADVYERQVRRQVERLEQVRTRLTA